MYNERLSIGVPIITFNNSGFWELESTDVSIHF